ncbi:hypothetical protein GC093_06135 [Paenibacillus sp. LMG 31456]|uniref:Uncharacterized protein n=1 Tax=Paenibacillus foliorum TaxID=2654974 RepID=A0A972GML7_9BACL|nr:hypothetical protein [Paenibacillus foliorum]NOU92810.1 hypothetical protein [Paenibacillus foliorum]
MLKNKKTKIPDGKRPDQQEYPQISFQQQSEYQIGFKNERVWYNFTIKRGNNSFQSNFNSQMLGDRLCH